MYSDPTQEPASEKEEYHAYLGQRYFFQNKGMLLLAAAVMVGAQVEVGWRANIRGGLAGVFALAVAALLTDRTSHRPSLIEGLVVTFVMSVISVILPVLVMLGEVPEIAWLLMAGSTVLALCVPLMEHLPLAPVTPEEHRRRNNVAGLFLVLLVCGFAVPFLIYQRQGGDAAFVLLSGFALMKAKPLVGAVLRVQTPDEHTDAVRETIALHFIYCLLLAAGMGLEVTGRMGFL